MNNIPDNIKHQSQHVAYLDAIRGIAATMVLVYHYIGWKFHDKLIIKLSCIVFNGSDAVSFFFVLSGLVLSYKAIVLGHQMDIAQFFVARIFRLLPGFAVIVLAITFYWHRHETVPQMLQNIFIKDTTNFWKEVFLLRTRPNAYEPGWTLSVELGLSFLMPFFIIIAKQARPALKWLLISLLLAGSLVSQFSVHFLLGVILACNFQYFQSNAFFTSRWYRHRFWILCLAVVLFSLRHIDRIVPFGKAYNELSQYLNIDTFLFTGIASFVFLVWVIANKKLQQFLNKPTLLFFGKISYGIYLAHWFFVVFIFDYWDKWLFYFGDVKMTFIIMFLLCFLATVLGAIGIHYFIEKPFMDLGKKVIKRMKPSFLIS